MKKLLLPIIIIALSTIVLFYKAADIPKHLAFDEVEFAQLALSLDGKPYTAYSPFATGHSTLYFYIILLSFKLIGIGEFALRLPSAVFGTLSLLIFYAIMKKVLKNDLIAFFSTLVFLSLRWFITFSRFAFEPTFLLFLELFSIWFLIEFLEIKSIRSLVLTAFLSGLAFLSYTPERIFFIFPLIAIIFATKKIKYVFIFGMVFLITVSLLLTYLITNPDQRIQQVSVLSDSRLSSSQKLKSIAENVKRTVLMFNFEGDMNGRHNYPSKPALNPILGLLFIGGVAVTYTRYKNSYSLLFLGYFLLSLVPTLFTKTEDNPNMLRTFTVIVLIPYTISYLFKHVLSIRNRSYKLGLFCGLILLLTFSTIYELRTYFLFQSRVMRNSFEVTCPLKKVVKYERKNIPKKCRVQKNLF